MTCNMFNRQIRKEANKQIKTDNREGKVAAQNHWCQRQTRAGEDHMIGLEFDTAYHAMFRYSASKR